jgi:hypothetical protein
MGKKSSGYDFYKRQQHNNYQSCGTRLEIGACEEGPIIVMTTLEFGSLELGSLVLPPLTFRSARD